MQLAKKLAVDSKFFGPEETKSQNRKNAKFFLIPKTLFLLANYYITNTFQFKRLKHIVAVFALLCYICLPL
jgi:hypothetical protein